ncbi:tetratricopeptide repeat protein [Metarhizium guizhouense ARSEF 977]|uniref:Tetratricopeptide repeat protein n=1 Tax=Metarhizium guizhouense (strain ARSEF 977) TaxID=1276136 RepID=A0A0B4H550_METGA|nr:tetratricopeptide repeat protein [Metarhizium guizhouense ARSEF 977]
MDGLTCNGDEFSLDWQGLVARSRQNSDRAEYPKALAILRNSVGRFSGADRLRILLEIASILGAQGYKRDALETLTEDVGELTNDLTPEETCLSTQMKMETCLLRPLVTSSFKMALEEAEILRSQTSNFAATKDLDSAMIETALAYAKLRFLSCEYHRPVAHTELEAIISWMLPTFDNLISACRYRESRKIIHAYGVFLASAPKLGVTNVDFQSWNRMIESVLSVPDAPPLIKADVMAQLAMRADDELDGEQIIKLEEDAIKLYNAEGHLVGAMDVRCQQISRAIKRDHTSLSDEILEEMKGYFEKYEATESLVSYQTAVHAMLAHIPHWLGFDVQLQLSHINDELARLSGALLISQAVRFRLIAQWLTRSGAAPRAVEASEAVYAALQDGDCVYFQGMAAHCASQAYFQLQDHARAQSWAERAASLWGRGFPHLRTDATNILLHAKIGPGAENTETMKDVISFAEAEIESDVNNGFMTHAQQKAEMIIGQLTRLRSDERYKWMERAEQWMKNDAASSLEESDVRRAALYQLRATHLGANIQSTQAEAWEPCMAVFEDAVSLYMKHKRLLEAANTRMMQSRAVFRHFQLSPLMELLQRSLELMDISLDLFKTVDNVAFITSANQYRSSTIYTGWKCGWVSAEAVLAALGDAEEAWARQRADMTVFASLEAVSRRQQLTSIKDLRDVYQLAFSVCLESGKLRELWEWTQRGKARSLSDQLGVDGIIPADLRKQALDCPKRKDLIQKSEQLSNQISSSTNIARLRLRGELDAVHTQMRADPLLNTILDIKNGTPVKLEQIQQLALGMKRDDPRRDIVFVDWVEYLGHFWVVLLRGASEQPTVVRCSPSVDDVVSWKQEWMDADPGQVSALEEGDLYPEDDPEFSLRALDGLVAPLENLTQPRDLLVFCPTGILHSIPLHALWIASKTLILERNPIVYSVSLTTFWQCCDRARSARKLAPASDEMENGRITSRKWTFAGVFEPVPDESFNPKEQDRVYSLIAETAATLKAASATGATVTKKHVRESLEDSALFTFYGHCRLEREDLAAQGLQLADGRLTVRDMFDMKLHAPHVTLVACDSASQGIAAGDEPLGIVTALLCAGAGSVLGTIWPTATRAGRRFTTQLYRRILHHRANGGKAGLIDLAEITQGAALALRQDMDTIQPYHWAAFVLHGSWAMYD